MKNLGVPVAISHWFEIYYWDFIDDRFIKKWYRGDFTAILMICGNLRSKGHMDGIGMGFCTRGFLPRFRSYVFEVISYCVFIKPCAIRGGGGLSNARVSSVYD